MMKWKLMALVVSGLPRGRMAAMVRLLGDGSYSETRPEEVGHKKLAAQSIHGELCNVDEANLLDEEERCRLLNSMEEFFLEVDGIGGNGHKKPPRKGRKKSQTVQEIGVRGRFYIMDGTETTALESVVDDENGSTSFSREAKGNSSRIGGVSVKDVSVACPGNANHPLVGLSSSEKRTKIAAEHLLTPEGLEAVHGVTRNNGLNYVKASTSPPLPLATKMYHSQRNHRLRCALKHLYHEASMKEHTSDPMSPKLVQENVMLSSQVSLPKDLLHDSQSDEFLQKKDTCSLVTVREHDQILAQSSDLCLGNSRGYPSAVDFAGKFRDNSFPRPAPSVETATMGKMRSRYLSTTYSYPGNSGTPLGTMQQQNGSVHVV
ncbi:hypothetical protein IFM89_016957 [Coptis chinensis]|uniref:Uncharacterized protein n=1 Tax=Coptis chinensis TaxID=261450 RepID=A0A835LS09_9MAGN|nr:hypothetical protein IFM89_016957 [Coptis chinensis]